MPPFGPPDGVLAALIVGCVYTDVTTQKIRNVLTFPVMLTGILMAPLFLPHWYWGAAGWLAAALVTIPAFAFGRALHAGDVKMLMAAGALMGPEAAVRAAIFTFALGFPVGLLTLAVKGKLGNVYRFWVKGDRSDPTVVYHAPVVAMGILLARLQPWPDLWQ
jgi:prepilin signal peptidase PulO-like enzyme (type II secretory pathway)